ncbi:hypothetical protein ACQ859_06150 [Roseateles chitinivorans]|uniref:hypothetical protein n=1 Tax=Roseateles chitinivorans TaxID=2917965 RepID=UPI003D66856A
MDHPRRWIVAGGLLLTAAAVAVQSWRESPTDEPVAPTGSSAVQPPTAAGSGVTTIAPQTAPMRPAAVSIDRTSPTIPPSGIGASAAMLDFGQIVITAVNGGSPKLAGKAARLIDGCRATRDLAQAVAMLKADGRLDEASATLISQSVDERERQCQSIPLEMMPRQKELAERALLGGERGVALIYANLVAFNPPDAMRLPLRDALRADFLAGDTTTALSLARHADLFDLSRVETRAYEIVFDAQNDRMKDALNASGFATPQPALSDEEQRQAEGLAQTWLRSVRKPLASEAP